MNKDDIMRMAKESGAKRLVCGKLSVINWRLLW